MRGGLAGGGIIYLYYTLLDDLGPLSRHFGVRIKVFEISEASSFIWNKRKNIFSSYALIFGHCQQGGPGSSPGSTKSKKFFSSFIALFVLMVDYIENCVNG